MSSLIRYVYEVLVIFGSLFSDLIRRIAAAKRVTGATIREPRTVRKRKWLKFYSFSHTKI